MGWGFRLSPTGEVLWERFYDSPRFPELEPRLNDVTELPDGRICYTGNVYTKDSATGFLMQDAWVFTMDANGCNVEGCDKQGFLTNTADVFYNERIAVFPSPSANYTNISLDVGHQVKTIELYDVSGKIHRRINTDANQTSYEIHKKGLAEGLYFLIFKNNDSVVGQKKIVFK